MANAASSQPLISALLERIAALGKSCAMLHSGNYVIQSKRQTSHWPAPTSEDYESLHLDSIPANSPNGDWSTILWKTRATLSQWWECWTGANEALDAVAADKRLRKAFDVIEGGFAHWEFRLRRVLELLRCRIADTRPLGGEAVGAREIQAFVQNPLADDWNDIAKEILPFCTDLVPIRDAKAAEPEPPAAKRGPTGDSPGMSLEAQAMAVLVDHPEWTDVKIAETIGCHRTTLYDFPNFKASRAVLRANKKSMRKGTKDKDGNIEAWDDNQ